MGADINLNAPIIRLLIRQKEDVIRYLLEKGAQPFNQGSHPQGVRYLLDRKASPELRQYYTQFGYVIPAFLTPIPLMFEEGEDEEEEAEEVEEM